MKKLFALAALAAFTASAALADPTFEIMSTETVGANTAYTIGINWNDSATAAGYYSLTVKAANGTDTIAPVQLAAFGGSVNVNTFGDSNLYQGLPGSGYTANADSWWFGGTGTPWGIAVPPFGGVQNGAPGATDFRASYGTDPSTPVNGVTSVAHIVLPTGTQASLIGEVARLGVNYPDQLFVFGGGGGAPVLSLSTTSLSFGDVRIGTSASMSLSASNSGVGDLTGNFGAAAAPFSPTTSEAFGPLGAGASDSRDYTYTPTAHAADAGNVEVTSNGGNGTVSLSGTGVGPVFADDDADDTIDFGNVLAFNPVDRTLTVSNDTTDAPTGALTDLTITGYTITGADAADFSVVVDPTGQVISKGGDLAIVIRATYGGTPNVPANATLTLTTDQGAALGGDGEDFTFALTAFMVPEPSTVVLGGLGALALVAMARRRMVA